MSVIRVFNRFKQPVGIFGLTFTPDGYSTVFANQNNIYVCNTNSGYLRARINQERGINCFTSDSKQIIFLTNDFHVKSWSMFADPVSKFHVKDCLPHQNYAIALTPDKKFILITTSIDIKIFCMDNNRYVRSLSARSGWQYRPIDNLYVTSEHVVASACDCLRVWSFASGILERTIEDDVRNCHAIISPDSKLIFVARVDGCISTYCIITGRQLAKVEIVDRNPILNIAISHDSKYIACATDSNVVCIVNVQDPSARPLTHPFKISMVAFHPNDNMLVSANRNTRVTLWLTQEWSQSIHFFFRGEFKTVIFTLLCVKSRLDAQMYNLPQLPMTAWLNIFSYIHCLHFKELNPFET